MFARDIDLLIIEPALFADVGWTGQRLLSAAGTLSGTTLTLAGTDLAAAGIEAGSVLLMYGTPLEIIERTSSTTLTVSLVRWTRSGPPIPPVGMTSGTCEVWTLRPQIALAHRVVLATLGVSPTGDALAASGTDGPPVSETAILNPGALQMLEALVALQIIYSAAQPAAQSGSVIHDKVAQYRIRAGDERARIAALIDLDGDGHAEATRRPSIIPLVRG